MHPLFHNLVQSLTFRGQIDRDLTLFLTHQGFPRIAGHCSRVAAEASRLAQRFNIDPEAASVAGWLHDVSVVFPNHARLQTAQALKLQVLPEEEVFPMLLHQKISAVMAQEIFNVQDDVILSAIGCHTTLRPNPSPLDLALFVADKVAWDQPGEPPYLESIQAGLHRSLHAASLAYLNYLWENRRALAGPLHPWAAAARDNLHDMEFRPATGEDF